MCVYNNSNVRNSQPLNFGGIVSLVATVYFVYYLLLKQKLLPFSISSVLSWSSQWSKHGHILAVGLVPIYLGLMIFGTAVLSLYLGNAFQRWVTQRWQ
jgi:hypothetical protein